jgi:hypothetical protein
VVVPGGYTLGASQILGDDRLELFFFIFIILLAVDVVIVVIGVDLKKGALTFVV